ncbi:peptidase, M16 (pitrilysin) family protein [Catenovulum agarivorans DS-2]|uniref:Protease 3 n=1 Tax=Catenovulum agarivorans DS-2 TaxID=1328313 RepID=W7Q637_9ALTE|nr:insulinase family protein [Catenovulum agarivorans]EWH08239.1 peptidase, M16 (pitrilysin) family protein [Catenovulum agarivorans DS-2]
MQNKRFKGRFLIVGLFAMISAWGCSSSLQPADHLRGQLVVSGDLDKSPADVRQYKSIWLDNGLQVVLVSDPNAANSVASLSVGAGSAQDPIELPGLAHFLEHLIWTASEQYPIPNLLKSLVEQNAGYTNAFTQINNTQYFFAIDNANFSEALKMLSAAISKPLLFAELTDKEITAVDNEWHRAKQNDNFISHRVLANIFNSNHSLSRFTMGNRQTLTAHSNKQLKQALLRFHQQYYSANLMKLVIAGNQPISELVKLAKQTFSSVPNRNSQIVHDKNAWYSEEHLGREVFVKRKAQGHELSLNFFLPKSDNWQKRSFQYIAQLLNSSEKGALKQQLESKGWISNYASYAIPDAFSHTGLVSLNVTLTEAGTIQTEQIIAAFFAFTKLILEQGINESYYAAMQKPMHRSWLEYKQPDLVWLVNQIASLLHTMPTKDVLAEGYLALDFDPIEITNILSGLTPENMLLWHLSNHEEVEHDLDYAIGGYRVQKLTSERMDSWKKTNLVLNLPAIETQKVESQNVEVVDSLAKPTELTLTETAAVSAWLIHSQKFPGDTSGVLRLRLQTPDVLATPKNLVMAHLINNFLKNENQAIKERAFKLDGISIDDRSNNHGMTELALFGNTQKQTKYALQLIDNFTTLTFEQSAIEREVEPYVNSLRNETYNQTPAQLHSYLAQNLSMPPVHFTNKQRIDALLSITVADLEAFHKKMLSNNFVEIMAGGFYSKVQIQKFAQNIRGKLGPSSMKQPWVYEINYLPRSNSILAESDLENNGLLDIYVYPIYSEKVEIQLTLLNYLLAPSAFNSLRTQQQLGYVVDSQVVKVFDLPSIGILIESNEVELIKLKSATNQFLQAFSKPLTNVSAAEFEQLKVALLAHYNKQPANLIEEMNVYMYDWYQGKLGYNSFASHQQHKQLIMDTTLEDIRFLYRELFLSDEAINLTVQLKGTKFVGSEYYQQLN